MGLIETVRDALVVTFWVDTTVKGNRVFVSVIHFCLNARGTMQCVSCKCVFHSITALHHTIFERPAQNYSAFGPLQPVRMDVFVSNKALVL